MPLKSEKCFVCLFSEQILKNMITTCLTEANRRGVQSVALPSLGTGANGFPPADAAKAMLEATLEFDRSNPGGSLEVVSFVIFHQNDLQVFLDEAQAICHAKVAVDDSRPVTGRAVPSSSRKPKVARPDRDAFADSMVLSPDQDHFGAANDSTPWSVVNGVLSIDIPDSTVHLDIREGDITKAASQAIVTTAAKSLKMKEAAMARLLLKSCGNSVQTECDQLRANQSFSDCDAFTTGPGDLMNCQKIIHAICPKADSGGGKKSLEKLVTNCLDEAKKHKLTSIAVPALGAGGLGYTPTVCAQATLSAIAKFASQPGTVTNISIVLFKIEHVAPFHQEFKKQFAPKAPSSASRLTTLVKGILPSLPSFLSTPSTPAKPAVAKKVAPKEKRGLDTLILSPRRTGADSYSLTLLGISARDVANAKSKMVAYVKDNHTVDTLNSRLLEKLSMADSQKIDAIQDDLGVVFERKGADLELEGETARVMDAKFKIMEILNQAADAARNEEHAARTMEKVRWGRFVSGQIEEYDWNVNMELEEAFENREVTVLIRHKGKKYVVNVQTKEELPEIVPHGVRVDPVQVVRQDLQGNHVLIPTIMAGISSSNEETPAIIPDRQVSNAPTSI